MRSNQCIVELLCCCCAISLTLSGCADAGVELEENINITADNQVVVLPYGTTANSSLTAGVELEENINITADNQVVVLPYGTTANSSFTAGREGRSLKCWMMGAVFTPTAGVACWGYEKYNAYLDTLESNRAAVKALFEDGTHGLVKRKCVGVNTDNCKEAKQSIPVTNGWFAGDIACHDCFVGFSADFFMEYEVNKGRLARVAGGFRNGQMTANLGLSVEKWENTLWEYKKNLLKWKSTIYSDGLLSMYAGLSIDFEALVKLKVSHETQVGTKIIYDHGDDYVEWTEQGGWKTVRNRGSGTAISPYGHAEVREEITIEGSIAMPVKLSFEVTGPFADLLDSVSDKDYMKDGMFTHKTSFIPKATISATATATSSGGGWWSSPSWGICVNGAFDATLETATILQYPRVIRALGLLDDYWFWPEELTLDEFWDTKRQYRFWEKKVKVIDMTLSEKCKAIK